MALELRQQLKLTQQLIMTPQLQQAIKLLQLSRLELLETISQEMEENPVLEELTAGESEQEEEKGDGKDEPIRETPEIAATTPAHAPASDRPDRVRSILLSLRVLIRAIQDYSRWVESQCGLTSVQLWALWELFTTPGMKVSELAAALYIRSPSASAA